MRQRTPKSQTLYKTPFSRAYWRDAAAELKDTKILVFAALMIALRVALKGLGIPLAPNLKVNIAFFVNALGAMTFGPVVAIVAAVISDTLGVLIFPSGPYFFPYIFIEIAGSLIFALFLYRAKVTPTRVMLSRFCIDFFVNIVLNAPITWLYYKFIMGQSYLWFQLPHILKNLFMFPVESVLLTLFLTSLIPVCRRFGMVYDSGESLRFSKKQIALLAVLFAVGVGSVGGYLVYNYNSSNQASWLSEQEKRDMNQALAEQAQAQGLLESGQLVVISKVDREYGGDTQVKFQVYDPSDETDRNAAAAYRSTQAKKDDTLTLVGTGSAILKEDSLQEIQQLQITPEDPE